MNYFVPPHIINKVAITNDAAKKTALHSHVCRVTREKETEKHLLAPSLSTTLKNKKPSVIIWDCKNTEETRKYSADPNDPEVAIVKDFVEFTLFYLRDTLGRNSIDGKGSDVHVNIHFSKDFMNAFWDGFQFCMGDGDGQIFTSFAKSLDVIAHEMCHGVTQFSGGLQYYGQSGALNEHFSDVFGSAIQQAYLKQTAHSADWLVGNEIMGPAMYGESLRSMAFPGTAYGNDILGIDTQPAHMKDYYKGKDDNAGVHINSGIPNKGFYLVCLEIGTDNATKLWYNVLQNLWPTVDFSHMAAVTVALARKMVSNGELPQGTTQIVRAAFDEVGISKNI